LLNLSQQPQSVGVIADPSSAAASPNKGGAVGTQRSLAIFGGRQRQQRRSRRLSLDEIGERLALDRMAMELSVEMAMPDDHESLKDR
jgi:hypothetical protein